MTEFSVIEVAWLREGAHAQVMSVRVPEHATVADVLAMCFDEQTFAPEHLSVFGQPCTLQTRLQHGDRLEITGPLRVDPKEARHRRVAIQRQKRAT